MSYLLLILGLVTLIIAGEILVKGAVSLAYKFHISTLVVGMTIVSFGTSAPELLVSLKAVLDGHPDISIGNVVGSNVANLALVMGLTALVYPIVVDRNSIRFDWPMMMLSTILLYFLMYDGWLVFWEGALMFALIIAFSVFLIWKSRKDNTTNRVEEPKQENEIKSSMIKDVTFIIVGCVGLAFGADWLVTGAVDVAKSFGVSDLVISVTVIALGTSAPELITSLVAATKKHTDISVGNLIGSNIFNILAILGITSMTSDIKISKEVIHFDMFWVLGIAFIVLPFMLNNKKVSRIEGGLLFLAYVSYMIVLLFFK